MVGAAVRGLPALGPGISPATIAFSICLAWRPESPPTQMSVNGFFSFFSPRALLSVRRPADAALCPTRPRHQPSAQLRACVSSLPGAMLPRVAYTATDCAFPPRTSSVCSGSVNLTQARSLLRNI